MICIQLKRHEDWHWVRKGNDRWAAHVDELVRERLRLVGNGSRFHLMKPDFDNKFNTYNELYACFRERRDAMKFALLMENINIIHKDEYLIIGASKSIMSKGWKPVMSKSDKTN